MPDNHPTLEQRESQSTVSSSGTAVQNDWLIVPGKRIGPITAQSSLSDLQTYFGHANVLSQKINGLEGEAYDGVVIFPNAPEKRVEVIWKARAKTPESVIIRENHDTDKSPWHTAEGIRLGTSLATLETLNDGPLTLSGFGWDYGGTVLSWGDHGRLKTLQQNGVVLRLSPSENAPAKVRDAVLGDGSFSSDNPDMCAVQPRVQEIRLIFQ